MRKSIYSIASKVIICFRLWVVFLLLSCNFGHAFALESTVIPLPLIKDGLQGRVESELDAGYIAALRYIWELTGGEIQTPPLPIKVLGGINKFASESDELWEVRFVLNDKIMALIFVNAENGKSLLVCDGHTAKLNNENMKYYPNLNMHCIPWDNVNNP